MKKEDKKPAKEESESDSDEFDFDMNDEDIEDEEIDSDLAGLSDDSEEEVKKPQVKQEKGKTHQTSDNGKNKFASLEKDSKL